MDKVAAAIAFGMGFGMSLAIQGLLIANGLEVLAVVLGVPVAFLFGLLAYDKLERAD